MATWQGYLRESHRFWDAAETCRDARHTSQAVSNAVLAVIAANDAVCLYLAGATAGGKSHAEAARALQRACRGTRLEEACAQQSRLLADVLQQKTAAQYLGKPMGSDVAHRVMQQAERFIGWVEDVLPPTGSVEDD